MEEFSIKDLGTLYEFLLPIAASWYEIGLVMKIADGELDAIKADSAQEGVKGCLRKVLGKWLKSPHHSCAPTKNKLIEILKSRSVNELTLADRLENSPSTSQVYTVVQSCFKC